MWQRIRCAKLIRVELDHNGWQNNSGMFEWQYLVCDDVDVGTPWCNCHVASDTGTRPVVAPGQMHLWSLTLWDAYNRLPSPASGVLDKPVGYCVEELIGKMLKSPEPSVPGQPILPDLTAVASGDKQISVSPSASCPWPTNVFETSAEAAIQSVANLSIYVDFEMEQKAKN